MSGPSSRLGASVIVALGLAVGMSTSEPAADECGDLQVPGYTASRTVGPLRQRALVSSAGERLEPEGKPGPIQIMTPQERIVLDPAGKRAAVFPKPTVPNPSAEQSKGLFVERTQSGVLSRVTLGFTLPDGKKEWTIKTTCRADGIFTERQVRTPNGMTTIRQTNIQVGAVPTSALSVPTDYQVTRP